MVLKNRAVASLQVLLMLIKDLEQYMYNHYRTIKNKVSRNLNNALAIKCLPNNCCFKFKLKYLTDLFGSFAALFFPCFWPSVDLILLQINQQCI